MARTDEAIEGIKQMILAGELAPGDRLPKESILADRLGLSRNTLREGVKALTLVRVLDVRRGDGTYVTSLQPEILLEAVAYLLDFHRSDNVLAVLEVRRILEPAATAMASAMMPMQEIAKLGELLEVMENAHDASELTEADLEFHRRIAAGSGNRALASLVDSLSVPSLRTRIWHDLAGEEEGGVAGASSGDASATIVAARMHEQHRAIFEALCVRQAEVARSWATAHIASVEDWLRRAR